MYYERKSENVITDFFFLFPIIMMRNYRLYVLFSYRVQNCSRPFRCKRRRKIHQSLSWVRKRDILMWCLMTVSLVNYNIINSVKRMCVVKLFYSHTRFQPHYNVNKNCRTTNYKGVIYACMHTCLISLKYTVCFKKRGIYLIYSF